MPSVSKDQPGLRPTQPGAGALESVVRRFETMPSNIGTIHRAGRSAQPSTRFGGWLPNRQATGAYNDYSHFPSGVYADLKPEL
jgi:hypothetical protein